MAKLRIYRMESKTFHEVVFDKETLGTNLEARQPHGRVGWVLLAESLDAKGQLAVCFSDDVPVLWKGRQGWLRRRVLGSIS